MKIVKKVFERDQKKGPFIKTYNIEQLPLIEPTRLAFEEGKIKRAMFETKDGQVTIYESQPDE